jgi:RHS repeat-associated protein
MGGDRLDSGSKVRSLNVSAMTYNYSVLTRRLVLAFLAALTLSHAAHAQSSTTTARSPGAPAGSYKLGDADTVNLFNGNLNYYLPLADVGGRGEARAELGVVIENQLDMKETDLGDGRLQHEYSNRVPDPLALVGRVRLDSSAVQTNESCDTSGDRYVTYRASVVYVEPDGTEHALRDRIYHSTPINVCSAAGANLGNVFESTSGDFITFVADANLNAADGCNTGGCPTVNGYLFFRGGAKARVEGGYVMWLQDRNGNKIEYQYEADPNNLGGQRLNKVIDSLGRDVNIRYDFVEEPYGRHTRITYKGFGGDDRIIRISRESDLQSILRATQTYDSTVIPGLSGIERPDPNNSIVLTGAFASPDYVKAIWLPDGRKYSFRYNVLGQLARVDLPTGGAVEYDFADVARLPFDPYVGTPGPVTNRVSEKRIYDGGGALVSRTVFSIPASYTQGVIPAQRGGVVRDVELFDGLGGRLGKSRHYFYGAPDANYGLLVPWWHGREFRSETFDADGATMLRVAESDWRQRAPSWCGTVWPCSANPAETAPTNNPFLVESKTTLVDGNLVSKVSAANPSLGISDPNSWAFDAYNNQTDSWQYDYGTSQPGALLKHVHTSYINNVTPPSQGSLYLSSLTDTTSVYAVDSGQERMAASTQTVYDEYGLYPLFTYGTVTGWQEPGGVRGNPTTVRRWLDTTGGWIETHARFDQLGNPRQSLDAMGRLTETKYDDHFTDNTDHHTFAFPTQVTSPVPDAAGTGHGSPSAFVTHALYDYQSGLVKTSTDVNGQITTYDYNDPSNPLVIDPLDRIRKVTGPDGGWTSFDYGLGDTADTRYVKTTTVLDETRSVGFYTFYDGLGRNVRSFSPKAGGLWVVADTQYDGAGRVSRVSKPYETNQSPNPAAGVNPAGNWVTTLYDALGRAYKITTADGSVAQTSYYGNTVTVTDAALRKRKIVSDAMGRLTQVVEDPGSLNFTTAYKYDVLGNLREVDQGPEGHPELTHQHRYYAYDSLSRLVLSRNPEQDANTDLVLKDASGTTITDPVTGNGQWSTKTEYNADGSVKAKTDARGIKIGYSYDGLGRLYQRMYTPTPGKTLPAGTYAETPAVDYYYDGAGLTSAPANSLGRLTRVSSSVSEMRYTGFDAVGRVTSSEQVVDGQTYSMPSYVYNLSGSLVSQVYPSGRVVKNDYDNAGKLSVVSGQAAGQAWKPYASDFDYSLTDAGATSRVKLGNGRWESTIYNKRLQPTTVGLGVAQGGTELMKLDYNYGATDNNGNIKTQTITVPTSGASTGFSATQSYGYDGLNRLTSAAETSGGQASWRQTFDYDQFGNRMMIRTGQTPTTPDLVGDDPVISTVNNRVAPRSGELYQYDATGNMTVDRAGNGYSFDGENMQASYTNAALGQVTSGQYSYDGDGRRVKKVTSAETTVFVYNAFGQMVAEYSTATPQAATPTTYVTSDPLGSPRVSTDNAGQVKARHDYLPFGEELSSYSGRANHAEYRADSVRQRFGGYQRDDENGLDYAGARYYASKVGRFTSVDPLMASASTTNPQTFNRYSYALNNPYRYVDPTGMEATGDGWGPDDYFTSTNATLDDLYAQEQAEREAARQQQQQQQTQTQQTGQQNQQQGQAPQQVTPEQALAMASQALAGFQNEHDQQAVNQAISDAQDAAGNYTALGMILTFEFRRPGDNSRFQPALNNLDATDGFHITTNPDTHVTAPTTRQNVFDGRRSLSPVRDDNGREMSVAQYFRANPDVRAITSGGMIFLGQGFFAQDRDGRAKSMLHETVVHKGFGRDDREFDSQGRRPDGSRNINSIIDRYYRRREPSPIN